MLLVVVLVIFGLGALRSGEFKITRKRKVDGNTSRILGIMMLLGAALSFLFGGWFGIGALIVAIVIGLINSKPITA